MKRTTTKKHCKTYYERHREQVISQQREQIHCNICNSLITRNRMNRHQETELCKQKALLGQVHKHYEISLYFIEFIVGADSNIL